MQLFYCREHTNDASGMPKKDCTRSNDTTPTNLTNVSLKMNSKTYDTNDDAPEGGKALNQDTKCKWDAFASLQLNYQESSSEEEDYDEGSEENDDMTDR